jgi:hypothetical protein
MLMTGAQPECSVHCIVPPPEVIVALENLYIVSSALAQRGTYAQEIRDSQWLAMIQRALEANTALDRHGSKLPGWHDASGRSFRHAQAGSPRVAL